MGKKAKPKRFDPTHGTSTTDDFLASIRKLRASKLHLVTDVVEKIVSDFSQADEFSIEQRREVLGRLIVTIFRHSDGLSPPPLQKPLWKDRDSSRRKLSPFQYLAETYKQELAAGSLTKSEIRKSDFSLYKALTNPYWSAKQNSENIFATLPTKKEHDDGALALLPKGLTRGAIINLLPPEIREMFRLLQVAEMRRHRSSKQ